jgi:hypothetical protein
MILPDNLDVGENNVNKDTCEHDLLKHFLDEPLDYLEIISRTDNMMIFLHLIRKRKNGVDSKIGLRIG